MNSHDLPSHPSAKAAVRKPRADGQRNREAILEVAKAAFTEHGATASLDDIAKKAGVGAGTLYRHFPTRADLIAAVYRAEVVRLTEDARRLNGELPAVEAIRAWLRLFIDHLATKKIIVGAINSLFGGTEAFEENLSEMRSAVREIYERAFQEGQMRSDINPADHMRAILGVTFFGESDDWHASAVRLVDILLLGSRPE